MNYFRCTVGGSGKGNTVTVTCAEEFAGLTITLSKTGKTYTKTCPSTAPYVVTFNGVENGTYTVSCTVDGQTYSETVIVQDISCVLNYGFTWRLWVDTASQLDSSDYDSLDEVLADEEALRELFLEHACVDYMAELASSNEDLETVINNDLCAKWINLSDYALDYLHANEVIADLMDEADKYGYGEWALLSQVPKMTSATAPYGEVIYSNQRSGDANKAAWHAFDGDTASGTYYWQAYPIQSYEYIGYKFPSPIVIEKAVYILVNVIGMNIVLQGSNDNSTWADLTDVRTYTSSEETSNTALPTFYVTKNKGAYLYYRFYCSNFNGSDNLTAKEILFYAWAPKGNVPVMTSNTAPYGVASSISEYGSGDRQTWKAFDKYLNRDDMWSDNSVASGSIAWIQYKFTNPVCVKKVALNLLLPERVSAINVSASNDGSTWNTLSSLDIPQAFTTQEYSINNDSYYLYYRVNFTKASSSPLNLIILQFYGRELKVSVPTMTSNTAPYGVASASSNSGIDAYKAFDGDDSSQWYTDAATDSAYIEYAFINDVVTKKAKIILRNEGSARTLFVVIKGSNDNSSWETLSESQSVTIQSNTNSLLDIELSNTEVYKYYKAEVSANDSASRIRITTLQFYGLDYSEKEFEVGTTKKWLYDHGVELVPFTTTKGSSTTTAKPINDGNEIYIAPLSGTNASSSNFSDIATAEKIDLTNYSLYRGILGTRMAFNSSGDIACGSMLIWSNLPTDGGSYNNSYRLAYSQQMSPLGDKCSKALLDISAVNQEGYVSANVQYYNGRSISFTELWLE